MLNRLLLGCIAALALAACEPEATALPVDIVPTTPPAPQPGTLQPVRYAIDSNLLMILPPEDFDTLAVTGEIESVSPPFLDSDLGSRYDILVTLGDRPNATRTPTPLTVSLALNTALPPLDDNAVAEIVRRAIHTEAMVGTLAIPGAAALSHASETAQTLRTSLANAGLPDGFDLNLASLYAPGAEVITAQLAGIGIETRISPIAPDVETDLSAYHLILFSSAAQPIVTNLAGVEIIDLFTVPISYRAVPELTIEFTTGGLPLARR